MTDISGNTGNIVAASVRIEHGVDHLQQLLNMAIKAAQKSDPDLATRIRRDQSSTAESLQEQLRILKSLNPEVASQVEKDFARPPLQASQQQQQGSAEQLDSQPSQLQQEQDTGSDS